MGIGFQVADRRTSVLALWDRDQRRDEPLLAVMNRKSGGRCWFHRSERGETTHLDSAGNAAIRVGPQFGVHRSWGYEESNAGTWRYGAAAVIGPRPRSVTWRWPTLQTAGPSCFDCGWKGIRNVGSLRIRWGAHAGG